MIVTTMQRCLRHASLYSVGFAVALLFSGFSGNAQQTTTPQQKQKAQTAVNASASQTNAIKIPLKVPWLPDPKASDPYSKSQQAIFKSFRDKYPDIELRSFSGIQIQNLGMESQLMLAIAGGSAPDVFSVNFRMSDTYIQQGFLYPLDAYVKQTYGSIDAYKKNIPGPIVPVSYREGPAIDGVPAGDHVWTVPTQILVRALVWRKDLFQEAGLDPDKPPKNWDELYEYAKKLTDPSRGRFGLSMGSGPQASWDFVAYLWSAGAEAVIKNDKGEWMAAFDTPEAVQALDFYMKLRNERWVDADGKVQHGYTTASASETDTKGSNLEIAMMSNYLDDSKMGGGQDASLYGIAPFPAGPTGKRGTEINSTMLGIFSGIAGRSNSEGQYVSADKIRDAAWKFISFMTSKEAQAITAKTYVDNGLGRYLSPLWLREFGYTEYLKYFPPEWEQAFHDAIRDGKPEPYGRNCQMVYLYMTQPLDDAMQAYRDGRLPPGPENESVRFELLQKFLQNAVKVTNERMIGKISPEERSRRNTYAMVVAVLIASLFCFVLYKIWQIFSPKDTYSGKKKGLELKRNWLGYLIMLPALISILVWIYYPMMSGSQILFQDYRVIGGSTWTGLNNFADVIFSKEWWMAVWNTFRYMILILSLGFFAPIILAILLQEVSCGKIIYRTLYYLPAVMSGLVVIYMWKLFYQPGPTGIMNQVLGYLFNLVGLPFSPIAWLEDAKWAMLACVIPTVWAGMGPGCLIYLAALKGVPDDIYEAAEIDGANFFQKIWHVTLPTLKALIIINFVGAFIGAANSGGMILIMTFGSANTEVAELHIFKEAYTNLSFGSAIAMAWMLGVLTLMFTLYNLKKLSSMEFKTTGK